LDLYNDVSVFFAETALSGSDFTQEWLTSRAWMGDLYKEVQNDPQGNAALALQTLLTAIASNVYYDYLQRLDRFDNATIVQFQNVSSPGGPYGTRRGNSEFAGEQQGLLSVYVKGRFPVGYTIVAVLLVIQTILAFLVLLRFLQETAITRIGDPWQTLAHVASDEYDINDIFELSRKIGIDRSTIDKELETKNQHLIRVGIESHSGTTRLTKGEEGHLA